MPAPVPSPAKPALLSDSGEDGAAAAAVWFLRDEFRYVIETNDVTDWKARSHPNCVFCSKTSDGAAASQAAGYVTRRDASTVTVIRVEELTPLVYSVLVRFTEPTISTYKSDGVRVRDSAGIGGQVLMLLHRDGPDWGLGEGQYFKDDVVVPTTGAS